MASPSANMQVVEPVGANSRGHASTLVGIFNIMSDCDESVLLALLVIEIIGTLIFLQYKIKLNNSVVSPEFEIKMRMSLFVIMPKSPWLASLGWIKNEGEPIDERVEEIFDAI